MHFLQHELLKIYNVSIYSGVMMKCEITYFLVGSYFEAITATFLTTEY